MKLKQIVWVVAFALLGFIQIACDGNSPNSGDQDQDQDLEAEEQPAELEGETATDNVEQPGEVEVEPEADPPADFDSVEVDEIEPEPEAAEETTPLTYCEKLELPERPFVQAESSTALYATATDFTLPTLVGDFHFEEEYSGCDTYLFIQDAPRQTVDEWTWDIGLWERDVDVLLERLPDNAHLFFLSVEQSEQVVLERIQAIRETIELQLFWMEEEKQQALRERIHYVTESVRSVQGWLGTSLRNPAWGVGIDRFQRIRYIGSYGDPQRYDSAVGWFAPNLSMAANEGVYYNFEAAREQRLETQDATVITLWDGEQLSGGRGYVEVELPDAQTMAGFDTAELDLYLGCVGAGEFGDCPAWDYIVDLYLCDADDPEICSTEFGRWITTYHREGRWVHDVSGLLPLIAQGGTRKFGFSTQQPYEVELSLRLFNSGKRARPEQAIWLFSGGGFGLDYNDKYDPVEVEVPLDAAKVELAVAITGHGMSEPGNCAEFCDTTHHFLVNGTERVVNFPEIGNNHGCLEQVSEGTVPNQYGTWWYGRSGWCPGKEVSLRMIDVTDLIVKGETNSFDYEGYFQGAPYPGGASIVLSSWVVISK